MFSKETESIQFYKKHLFGAAVTALTKLYETVLSSCCNGLLSCLDQSFLSCWKALWGYCDGLFGLMCRLFLKLL